MAPALPYQKTGKDFLSSSHFTIGMDNSFLSEQTKSGITPAHLAPGAVNQLPAKRMGDSNVMHSDLRDRTMPGSQTRDSYQYWGTATREWNDYSGRLDTNFLSHSDQKCLTFETTSSVHFKPENAVKFSSETQKSLMTSTVPMGDPGMVKFPTSEVRGNFRGQSVDHVKPSRYPAYIDYGIIDTMKTDRREAPGYPTTNTDMITGKFQPAEPQQHGAAALKRGAHSVGLGNETVPEHTTNVRDAYTKQDFTTKRYDKKTAMGKVLGTTFLFGREVPHAGTLDSDTTNRHYLTGTTYGPTQSMKPDNVFKSSFPEGDRHADRVRQLQNDTSYGEHFPVRAPGIIVNPKVKGEEIITKSRVVLGTDNPVLAASTKSCYVSQLEHIKPRDRVDQLVKFRRGFELGSDAQYRDPPNSEVKDNFRENPGFRKFQHNPTILGRLKDSHLVLTQECVPEYSTSYKSYFPTRVPDHQVLAPKLQTSSLPLGGFSRYISNVRK